LLTLIKSATATISEFWTVQWGVRLWFEAKYVKGHLSVVLFKYRAIHVSIHTSKM